VLSTFMRNQCLSHRFQMNTPMKVADLVGQVGEKAQYNTQHYGKRPYGVGLLVAGVDEEGPHLFMTQPSGLCDEVVAFAIGARSQMARTYLEKQVDDFAGCARDELVLHGLRALRESLVQDRELTIENTSVGIVGCDAKGRAKEPFKVHDGQDVHGWIERVNDESGGAPATAAAEEAGGESMEVDA
jgi:20S proteasome subunit alpha 6